MVCWMVDSRSCTIFPDEEDCEFPPALFFRMRKVSSHPVAIFVKIFRLRKVSSSKIFLSRIFHVKTAIKSSLTGLFVQGHPENLPHPDFLCKAIRRIFLIRISCAKPSGESPSTGFFVQGDPKNCFQAELLRL